MFLFSKADLDLVASDYLESLKISNFEGVLDEIASHHSILMERAAGIWSFMHLTFQEFFCAVYIIQERNEKQIIANYLDNPRWREVILMVASLISNGNDLIQSISEKILDGSLYRRLRPFFSPLFRIETNMGIKESKGFIDKIWSEAGDRKPDTKTSNRIQQIKIVRSLSPALGFHTKLPTELSSSFKKIPKKETWPGSIVPRILERYEGNWSDDFWFDVEKLRGQLDILVSCTELTAANPWVRKAAIDSVFGDMLRVAERSSI